MKDKIDDYLFEHFGPAIMLADMKFSRTSLKPDDSIPDVTVVTAQGRTTGLYELGEGKPMLLVTGSITCPMTVNSLPGLQEIQRKVDDKIKIVLVYVREAHPGENTPQPMTFEDKLRNARTFLARYGADFTVIVDDPNGSLHKLLDVKPNSVHLLDHKGKIVYQSLWAGDSANLFYAINRILDGKNLERKISQKMLLPFLHGAGFIDETLKSAGRQSYRELLIGAPPVWLLARTASLWSFLPQPKRGVVAMAFLILLGGALLLRVIR
ncbi:MAG: TlpA family protein disulfide reductase [Gammaproteobacteria bacterium]